MTRSHRAAGTEGEGIAAEFLQTNGYRIIERNYYYQRGEIDIVAEEGAVLAFVEVKMRSSSAFGSPEEFVTPKKQELIRRTAEGYVMERNIVDRECRFDVVSVLHEHGSTNCTLFRNCF